MGAAPVVILLVAMGGAREPSTRAMAAATQSALDPEALVLVREVPEGTLTSDDRALSLLHAVHGDAIAVLTWPDAEHRHAHVHVYAEAPARWVERDIDFRSVDAAEERGKVLGFAVASMLPARRERAKRDEEPRVAAEPPRPPAPREPAPPRDRRGAIDLAATASTGVGGYAGGFGSEASARWRFAPTFAVRVGGGLRIGEVAPARASSYFTHLAAGLVWAPLSTGGERPVSLALRADALLLLDTLSRPTTTDATSRGSRWTPGGDALLELTWTFVPEAGLVAGGGTQITASGTRIFVDRDLVATIPRLRIVGEFGVRVSF